MLRFMVSCALVAALAVPVQASLLVETVTCTGVSDYVVPGNAVPGGGLQFSGPGMISTVDFAPGAVVFQGQPVDFDGKEPQFIASAYSVNIVFPVSSGPGSVNITGVGNSTGAVTGIWLGTSQGVAIGPTFGINRLDLTNGDNQSSSWINQNWNSTQVPQLNGHQVTVAGTMTITGVDAVNGIVNFSANGGIHSSPEMPIVSASGVALLLAGLGGLAFLVLRRRTSATPI